MDILKAAGIDSKGYGRIYKLVMRRQELPITAKAIYAYFCAYAGSGTTAFPHRDKITRDLRLNKDTYTKYLNVLTDSGLIRKRRTVTGNLYEVVMQPMMFGQEETNTSYDILRAKGVKAQGYGTVPKLAMLDRRLTPQAKALYAYFCSFAGSGTVAFPRKDTIVRELEISERTYYTHFRLLIDLGYVSVSQRKENGRFGVSEYLLNDTVTVPETGVWAALKSLTAPLSEKLLCGGKGGGTAGDPLSEKLLSEKLPSEKWGCGNSGHAVTRNSSANNISDKELVCNQQSDGGLGSIGTHTLGDIKERIGYAALQVDIEAMAQIKERLHQFSSPGQRRQYTQTALELLDQMALQAKVLLNCRAGTTWANDEPWDTLELQVSLLDRLNQASALELLQKAAERYQEIRNVKSYAKAMICNFAGI